MVMKSKTLGCSACYFDSWLLNFLDSEYISLHVLVKFMSK